MDHYKSWGGLRKWLEDSLCDELRGRVTYFLTRYEKVHNAYGRAAVRVDGEEKVIFSWIEGYHQERDQDRLWREEGKPAFDDELTARYNKALKAEWDEKCAYCERDFLFAVLRFRGMTVRDALNDEDYIVKLLAIMDRRVGSRTLAAIGADKAYESYPEWVRQFYCLRLKGGRDASDR